MKGNLIIISSPSGGGKGTLIREIMRTLPGITFSVSYTTRKIREGETHGKEYFFVDRNEFEKLIAEGEFIEYAEVHGNYYGTSRKQVDAIMAEGSDVLLEIDVQGAAILNRTLTEAVSIFILPPSFPTLQTRLTLRATESSGDLQVRLNNAFREVKEYSSFKYTIINDDLPKAVDELRTVILGERLKTDRQMDKIQVILDGFDASKAKFNS